MAQVTGVDDQIDRLYQLPLAEFVTARNALVKQAGARAAEIKSLQKPHVAAWAVNQLYWRHRKTYDRVTAAAERARKALTQSLGGRGGETAAADSAYEQAVNQAAGEAREILKAAGAPTSATSLRFVRDTLLALPGDERQGRLTRPLAPMGFESLTSVLKRAGQLPRPPATVLKFAGAKADAKKEAAAKAVADRAREKEDKQAALERARELAKIERELKGAQAAARDADTALAAARRTQAKAERRLKDLQTAVEAATTDVERGGADVRRLERAAKDATTARDQLEFRRKSM